MSNEYALHASVAEMLALLDIQQSPQEWTTFLQNTHTTLKVFQERVSP